MKANYLKGLISILLILFAFVSYGAVKGLNKYICFQRKNISGVAQIGPFVEGATVRMTELEATAIPLERTYNTHIRQNSGAYIIPIYSQLSDYVKMEVYGYYHNIITDKKSLMPVTLFAITDLKDVNSVNVNVLSDLEKLRVEHLVQEESINIKEAKQKAQAEILKIFGVEFDNMPPSETLSITGGEEADAILLAITIILQADHSALELERLLETIGHDIRETGVLSNVNLLRHLRVFAANVDVEQIIGNIKKTYGSADSKISLPYVQKYINVFLENYSAAPTVRTMRANVMDNESVILHAMVNPNGALTTIAFEYQKKDDEHKTVFADQGFVHGITDYFVNTSITDLFPATLYFYRVIAYNRNDTVYGKHLSFLSPPEKNGQFKVGLHAGISFMDYYLSKASDYKQLGFDEISVKPGLGIRLGFSVNYRITESLNVFSSPGISMYDILVEFHTAPKQTFYTLPKQKTEFFPIELPVGVSYSFLKNRNTRPYVLAGLKCVYDFNSSEKRAGSDYNIVFRTKQFDFQTELGIGVRRHLKYVRISAELKAMIGFNNLILPGNNHTWGDLDPRIYYNAIDSIRKRGIMISLIFD